MKYHSTVAHEMEMCIRDSEQVERERISPDLGEDCDTCPDFAACRPVPMIYR